MSDTTTSSTEGTDAGGERGRGSGAARTPTGRAARRAHRTAVTRQAASVLLGYPDERFFDRLPLVARAVAGIPRGAVREALDEFCEYATTTPELELCEHYVDVFDLRRRRTLHLTYYTDGDTRRRGHALAEVAGVYTRAGWRVSANELPDHLSVVLEFAARGDAAAGEELLARFRPGLEMLGTALHAHGTVYARVVDAVRLTLPSPRRGDREAARRLAAQGPPAEAVGLEPYGVGVPLPLTDVTGRGGGGGGGER
ncbi:respiratory nitrate reductase chaperone NarJ [Nocardiopsis sp. Huas11]|uniref:nitrate reductase molybdenum cofactor assembly chaperone n=1 Tax=Nocardiopsis sp. Huas11 TaxID=2183912 RepID=UPI000EB06315|nr:nitrate reductase molybdenum cofactor assembly chaperone [Nocardiopsis sp. Huas11]RKS07234.1 respiratory nitrate reductase chaperone NarJ [Nocardiopsis sp. Huas11]